jgi:alanine racemase
MNRFGFDADDLEKVIERLTNQKAIRVGTIMSHLSSSGNETAEEFTLGQITQFQFMCETLKSSLQINPICHILNTDGINNYLNYQMDMVRLGIGLYGASEANHLKNDLMPVAKLTSKVIAIRRVTESDFISYNRSGSVAEDSNIALLSLGYADGVPRKLGNGNWQVEVNGKLYPTIGNICMDICMLNLGQDEVKLGDQATVFGGMKSIFEFAEAQETITYEALTNIGNRMKRKLI